MAKRIAIGIVGGSVLVIGICMIVLPGPAFVVIPVGLGILGLEFAWARIWLKKAKAKAEEMARNFRQQERQRRPSGPATVETVSRYSIGRSNISSRAKRTGGDPYDNTLS